MTDPEKKCNTLNISNHSYIFYTNLPFNKKLTLSQLNNKFVSNIKSTYILTSVLSMKTKDGWMKI